MHCKRSPTQLAPMTAGGMQDYIDAPHPASGSPPADVTPFFSGPYYEWWNAVKVLPEPCM